MYGLMFVAFIRRLFHADFIESGRFSLSIVDRQPIYPLSN